jgi:2-dehydro-3-deoxygluconokinase
MQKVALIGECMIELQGRPLGAIRQGFGGDTLNTATYLSRLTDRAYVEVEFVTALGQDTFSDTMLERWAQEGIGAKLVRRLPGALPGLYFIETDPGGERRFLYWRKDSAARRCFDGDQAEILLSELGRFDWVYLSGISLAILPAESRERLIRMLARLRARGGKVAFDNNYRPTLWPDPDTAVRAYREVLAHTDLALLTWEDDQALFGYTDTASLFDACAGSKIPEVVLKRGGEPCLIQWDGKRFEVAAERVDRVVDTTAAGDSFSAAYLACRLQGGSPELAARWGHRLAGEVIRHPGAIIDKAAMPVMPENLENARDV